MFALEEIFHPISNSYFFRFLISTIMKVDVVRNHHAAFKIFSKLIFLSYRWRWRPKISKLWLVQTWFLASSCDQCSFTWLKNVYRLKQQWGKSCWSQSAALTYNLHDLFTRSNVIEVCMKYNYDEVFNFITRYISRYMEFSIDSEY